MPGDLFLAEDWRSFDTGHDETPMAWPANLDAAWPEPLADNPRHDGHFRRIWRYCLSSSTAAYRTRRDQLWQPTLSPHGVPDGYRVPR